jgi:hypothetical protein
LADLYLDHNVPRALGDTLAAEGHTSRTVRQLGLETGKDDLHLLRCWQEGWVFVTHDAEDYELLHAAWVRWGAGWAVSAPPIHPGIIVLAQVGAAALAGPPVAFLAASPVLANRLYRWRQSEGWFVFDVVNDEWEQFVPS